MTAVFIRDAYLRGCWVEMMNAVAEQLESGVSIRALCGIDVPRVVRVPPNRLKLVIIRGKWRRRERDWRRLKC